MQYQITDRAAIEFARSFYESLAEGLPVDAAVAHGRIAIRLAVNNTVEWGTPVLYMRAKDGVLFSIQESEVGSQKSEEAAREAERLTEEKAEAERLAKEKAERERIAREKAEAEKCANLLIIDSPIHLELIRIPAGEFLMGSDKAKDPDAYDNELPQHRVYLSEYYLGKYPITNAQYAAFKKIEIPKGKEHHPVVNVSWDDAQAFCQWLSKKTGKQFRLPAEAEWEKSARGTDGRIYPWGNVWDASRLNSIESKTLRATPVGKYSPASDSPYGLADMCGNVWEWCADRYDENEYQRRANTIIHDPQGPESGTLRVVRGGAWNLYRSYCRGASRNRDEPSYFSNDVGFRVALSP